MLLYNEAINSGYRILPPDQIKGDVPSDSIFVEIKLNANAKKHFAPQLEKQQFEATLRKWKAEILDTGRFDKQFESVELLGRGGFGTVNKVKHRLEDQLYAVKKVRLHLPISEDLRNELKCHKVFREVLALANSLELNHTVRYFNSWVEELTVEEI